jgi:hypothetical protein
MRRFIKKKQDQTKQTNKQNKVKGRSIFKKVVKDETIIIWFSWVFCVCGY